MHRLFLTACCCSTTGTLEADDEQVNPDVGIHNRPWEALAKPQVSALTLAMPSRNFDGRVEHIIHRRDCKLNCD